MPRTPFSRSRSASSTRSPTCAKRSTPTSRMSPAASGSTIASAPKFLHAGPGYGGSCFPKDTLALLQTAEEAGVDQRIVRTTVQVNDDRKAAWPSGSQRAVGGELKGKSIGSARPRVQAEHRRHARCAVDPADQGAGRGGARCSAFDPVAREQAEKVLSGIDFATDAYAAARRRRRAGDRHRVGRIPGARSRKDRAVMRGKVLGRLAQCLRPRRSAAEAGLAYSGVGRGRLSARVSF